MKRFSCVIFDLDGTISQTNELIYATFNHVVGKYLGKVFTTAQIVATFGPPEEIAIERLVGKEQTKAAMADFYRFYEEHHDEMATAHAGIPELLRFLKDKGVRIALFTGKGRKTAIVTLEKFNILKYFDLIVSGSDVENHKPSGDGIRKALAAFRVAPEETLMVGDAVADVTAARETGVAIASVLWDSYGKADVLQLGVTDVFHSVAEFAAWLEPLAGAPEARVH
jgi:HAD superfamily hydrolase (TIGR01509 family)